MFRHGATYAAHATCCAAALANLGLLERDGLLERGREHETDLLKALSPLAGNDAVAEVRGGTGMLAAVALKDEIVASDPGAVAAVTMGAREAGVLVRPLPGAIATSPPLTAEPEHFAEIAEAIEHGLSALPALAPVAG
jgi:adenosylmethionine-8-amino-7-oxononanoate aminotransferase